MDPRTRPFRSTGAPAPIERNPVLDASPNAIVAIDSSGAITYANPQTERAFGYGLGELLGRPIEMLLPDRLRVRHIAHRDAYLANPVARPMGIGLDLSGRRKDGSEFPVEISLSPVDTSSGIQVFATLVDITARKAVDAALAESERRLRVALEASPNVIVSVDSAGIITYANPRTEAAFGYARDEVIGQPIELLLPTRLGNIHVAHRDGFFARPDARPMGIGLDLSGRRKDGTEFPVEISLSPVDTSDGVQVFATVVDITARKAAESQLLQAQKLESLGRLAGGIAHDFNNMLFAISGYAELLIEDVKAARATDPAVMLRSIEAIQSSAQRATTLTAQLLAFSRQQVVSARVLDLNASVVAVEPMIRRLIGENINLVLKPDPAAGHVRTDPGQLDQILVNLTVNARDAMPDGGTITIETGNTVFDEPYAVEHFEVAPGPYVMLAVSDSGVGMDRATREHIFEPFFTTKALGKGTGLGLATIYGIVRQAGGHIWLYSEPGLGSSFKLYFPRIDGALSPGPVVRARTASAVDVGMVLVVEDEPAVRDMTTEHLRRAGYDVRAVADGAAALALIDRLTEPVDVLVSDVIMPNLSGIALADQLMDRFPDMGVVLLSGYTAETLDLARITGRGAVFLSKPVTATTLLLAVRRAAEARQADG